MIMLVSKLLLFRRKYGISRSELGSACGLSEQWICELEIKARHHTPVTLEKLCRGLEAVLVQRRSSISAFSADLEKHKTSLLDYVEENAYEL